MLEFALGAEWPERVVSEAKGEKIAFARPGRGDRVAGFWLPGEGRKLLFIHPDGAEAARKSPEFAALVRTGRPIYTIDAFQTGAAVAPRNRDAKMFLTFNRATMPIAYRTSSPCCAGWTRPMSNWSASAKRPSGASSPPRFRGSASF